MTERPPTFKTFGNTDQPITLGPTIVPPPQSPSTEGREILMAVNMPHLSSRTAGEVADEVIERLREAGYEIRLAGEAADRAAGPLDRERLIEGLPTVLSEIDDAGSSPDDWSGSEYVERLADGILRLAADGKAATEAADRAAPRPALDVDVLRAELIREFKANGHYGRVAIWQGIDRVIDRLRGSR